MSNYFHEYHAKVLHRYSSQYTPRSTLRNKKEYQRATRIHFIVIYDNDLACWPSFEFYSTPDENSLRIEAYFKLAPTRTLLTVQIRYLGLHIFLIV